MLNGEEFAAGEVVRRIEDLSSHQYLDMAADAPSFAVPEQMDPDAQIAYLDTGERRLYFQAADGKEQFIQDPELRRMDHWRHDDVCLVTSGSSDERNRRIFWICRIER